MENINQKQFNLNNLKEKNRSEKKIHQEKNFLVTGNFNEKQLKIGLFQQFA